MSYLRNWNITVFVFLLFSEFQPQPPHINCAGTMPDPFCLAANWFHVMVKIHQEFCLFREPGIYPYPLSCERFVKCGVGKDTNVYICPNGTNFNQIISNCDYKQNLECNIPPNVKSKWTIAIILILTKFTGSTSASFLMMLNRPLKNRFQSLSFLLELRERFRNRWFCKGALGNCLSQ